MRTKLTRFVRSLVGAAALLAALPVTGGERTETIRLKYVTPGEVEVLLASHSHNLGGGADWPYQFEESYPRPGPHLVPEGVSGWQPDAQRNSLRVSGTADGIRQFKALIRSVDLPPAQLKVTVRVLRLTDAALREAAPELFRDDEIVVGWRSERYNFAHWGVECLSDSALKRLQALPEQSRRDFSVVCNRPFFTLLPRAHDPGLKLVSIVARYNADRSVSFMLPANVHVPRTDPPNQYGLAGKPYPPASTLHRVGVGQPLLVRPAGTEQAVLITAVMVLRELPEAPRKDP